MSKPTTPHKHRRTVAHAVLLPKDLSARVRSEAKRQNRSVSNFLVQAATLALATNTAEAA